MWHSFSRVFATTVSILKKNGVTEDSIIHRIIDYHNCHDHNSRLGTRKKTTSNIGAQFKNTKT